MFLVFWTRFPDIITWKLVSVDINLHRWTLSRTSVQDHKKHLQTFKPSSPGHTYLIILGILSLWSKERKWEKAGRTYPPYSISQAEFGCLFSSSSLVIHSSLKILMSPFPKLHFPCKSKTKWNETNQTKTTTKTTKTWIGSKNTEHLGEEADPLANGFSSLPIWCLFVTDATV